MFFYLAIALVVSLGYVCVCLSMCKHEQVVHVLSLRRLTCSRPQPLLFGLVQSESLGKRSFER